MLNSMQHVMSPQHNFICRTLYFCVISSVHLNIYVSRIFLCQHKAETFAWLFPAPWVLQNMSVYSSSRRHTVLCSDGSDALMWCGYKQIKVSPQHDKHKLHIYLAPVLLPISIKVVCCYKSKQFVWVRGCFLECPASHGSWPQSTIYSDKG